MPSDTISRKKPSSFFVCTCRALGPALWVLAMVLMAACGSSSKVTAPEEEAPPQSAHALKADIYDAMARVNRAQADADVEATEEALEAAMEGMRHLARIPGGLDDAESRELYRSVITAYEQYYGVSDTLALEYGDIYAFREEMFASMNQVREPLMEDVALPALEPVPLTVPMQKNQLVEQSIRYLLRNPENHLYNWIKRSATYFSLFERTLREEGVPDELKYLAMIESALNPRARSHAGAAGLWQFMPATGREYGLRRTHWIDERLDPEKSTRAAARYLKALHKQFGDWHLALAAYNSGPGRVSRALRRHGRDASFWDIYPDLPRETRNYVPMFIATALILSNPQAFDLPRLAPGPRYAYDVAQVEGMLDLRLVAELAGTDVETIRALNPEIRQWTTPPARSVYALRVPPGSGPRFAAAYAALPPEQRRGQTEYTVRRGDTLGKIARRYGTSVAALQEVNGLRGSLIREGQPLYVPVQYENYTDAVAPSGRVEYGATPVSNASTSGSWGEESRASTGSTRDTGGNTRVRYKVRSGDNLSRIAQKYGVSVSSLKSWNDLSGDRIRSGQMLTIYPGRAAPNAPAGQRLTHQVRRGESLSRIARKYGVTVAALKEWNNLPGDRIRSGQRLTVYTGTARAAAAASGGSKRWVAYYVKHGDNLTRIARKIGASVADVRRWNALRGDRLKVGQRLALYTAVRL